MVSDVIGINADTGQSITGWDHTMQSIRDIIVTDIGMRPMREYYGSLAMRALGRMINREEILPLISSIAAAIEVWEPRYRMLTFEIGGDAAAGRLELKISGEYRPRALSGDMTVAGVRTVNIGSNGGPFIVA